MRSYHRGVPHVDAGPLAALLARSYDRNPLIRWYDPEASFEAIESLFRALLDRSLPGGLVDLDSARRGVAIWSGPIAAPNGRSEASVAPPSRTANRRARALEAMEAARPRVPHRHLVAVGVDPAHRRKGVASCLLRSRIELCDRDATPVYVENSDPANGPFYRSLGFVETGPIDIEAGAPLVVGMWREPN